jgi:hypothetical protein
VGDKPARLEFDQVAGLGSPDPSDPRASDRLKLIRYVLDRGATIEQVEAAPNLGELALDLNLRSGPHTALAEVIAELGIGWAQAERIHTSLGFPADPDQRMTDDEAAAVRLLVEAGRELFGEEATV